MKRLLLSALVILGMSLFPNPCLAVSAGDTKAPLGGEPPEIEAQSVVLVDHTTGEYVLVKNPDEPRVPASLIKLLTLKLIWEAVEEGSASLDQGVTVSERAWRTGGSKMFIRAGTQVPLGDLIDGIIVASGNDACVAAAEYLEGSVEAFVARMNEKAEDLGMKNTRAVDPHGLSDENITTARDMALLASHYVQDHPEALDLHSTREFTYGAPGETPITQQNRNLLLWSYDGVDGLKTGYIEAAGFNMLVTARRGETRFLGVVLGVPGESIPEGEARRAQEVARILDFGFANFSSARVATAGEPVGEVKVWKGRENEVRAVVATDGLVTLRQGVKTQRELVLQDSVQAPVEKGQRLGELVISRDGQEVSRVPVVAETGVPRGGFFKVLMDTLRQFFGRIRITRS
ncbi:MAG: D-alanyl-D-alanine carboxypeptidase family protein [Bacillota bacterium]